MDLGRVIFTPRASGWRWIVVAGAVIAAAAHVPVIAPHLTEAPYMGVLFVLLTAACLAIASAMLVGDSTLVYGLAEVTCGLAIAGYIATRLVAFPHLSDDVGNWLEPLGIVSVMAEAAVVVGAIVALCTTTPPSAMKEHLTAAAALPRGFLG